MMKDRIFRIALACLVGLVIAAGIVWYQLETAKQVTTTGTAAVGGPFQLTDHTGKAVTEAAYAGKHLLIYFGYSYCPDVCPTELAAMTQGMDKAGPAAVDKIQPLFITVDPERDTVSHLRDYVGLFHPRLIGLTGTPEQVAAVAKAYRVYYAKAPQQGGGKDDYLMDHSSFIYLMAPDGKLLGVYPAQTKAETIGADLAKRLAG